VRPALPRSAPGVRIAFACVLNTLKYQPLKIAVMEGLWETGTRVPANLFAIPDDEAETNHFEISIPVLGSIYLTYIPNGLVHGIKDWPKRDRPVVPIVFFAFHLMVGLAILMLAVIVWGLVLRRGRRLYDSRSWLRASLCVTPIGFIAVLAGWTTSETGRQPWRVYNLMRTADSVTPSLTTIDVALSLTIYVVSYLMIFGAGFILLRRLVRIGPVDASQSGTDPDDRSARPLSAALSSQAGSADGAKLALATNASPKKGGDHGA
jgi:cytochrome d ubiquinol oxidase subunit I